MAITEEGLSDQEFINQLRKLDVFETYEAAHTEKDRLRSYLLTRFF